MCLSSTFPRSYPGGTTHQHCSTSKPHSAVKPSISVCRMEFLDVGSGSISDSGMTVLQACHDAEVVLISFIIVDGESNVPIELWTGGDPLVQQRESGKKQGSTAGYCRRVRRSLGSHGLQSPSLNDEGRDRGGSTLREGHKGKEKQLI
eukprot:CAMPEP_0174368232 /NCGR_PEP_ID=MMETSP0811_2-20130205/88323_1 /TAXON_ID=73025 ORGANISM="Eutreptiella gymnastica-like, Strain CCMP1594" /NCGR_SAMPLE_ID=MMETSP0811_2 /ASSEMBLY_ACC=CAM_ASM_000667 /LENGTH=147 /DNA_ID=CAMNT_0015511541 /DNA_START=339 /DNA_END=782 /DNA_ORIENTATION=-